ncbi:MAG: hypothetical protein HC800_12710 [Phormidesmis sp. RL_2_1]|nr:hypothetical protein [Phormidesmis sp. RL_2_1]
MIHGLMWLPLLGLFVGLAWAGWNEYRKLEAYKIWAQQFERAKYDIYAALGQQGDLLTWGLPTRQGIVEIHTLNLKTVKQAAVEVDAQPVENLAQLPRKGRFTIGFTLTDGDRKSIPFTEGEMACQWFAFLQKQWNLSGMDGGQ